MNSSEKYLIWTGNMVSSSKMLIHTNSKATHFVPQSIREPAVEGSAEEEQEQHLSKRNSLICSNSIPWRNGFLSISGVREHCHHLPYIYTLCIWKVNFLLCWRLHDSAHPTKPQVAKLAQLRGTRMGTQEKNINTELETFCKAWMPPLRRKVKSFWWPHVSRL